MAIPPEAIRLGVVFPSPAPLTRGQFETALRALNGKVTDAVGARGTGEQVPVLILQWAQGLALYDSTSGIVSIDITRIDDPTVVETSVVNPLVAAAGLRISDLKAFEVDASFVFSTATTALAALGHLAGAAPTWVDELMQTRMRGWGVRFVGVDATELKGPFREATPWSELTIEPFGNNPTKAFVRFVIRSKAWDETKRWMASLPAKADSVKERVFQ